MRRWLVVFGVVVALAGVLSALSAAGDPEFEAEVALQSRRWVDPALLREELRRPEVRELARQRLGYVPAIRLRPGEDGVIEVRARASTPELAAHGATTYVNTYLEVHAEEVRRQQGAASAALQEHVAQLDVQIARTEGAQRETLLAQRRLFTERLDQLTHGDMPANADVIQSTPGRSTGRNLGAWFVAGLGLLIVAAQVRGSVRRSSDQAAPAP